MSKRIQFLDQSKPGNSGPITAWSWDFDDGGYSSDQNPIHEYLSSGTYDVKLTVTGSGSDGSDDVVHSLVLDIPVPIADFSYEATGLSVAFTDHSEPGESGPIIDWDWVFGDGETSGGGSGGGEFPTTGLLDAFPYTLPGGLNGEGNWTCPMGGGGSGLRVSDHFPQTCNCSWGICSGYLNNTDYGPDTEVYADIVQLSTINPGNYMRLACRIQNPASTTLRCQYQVRCQPNGTWLIERVTNNSTTTLATFTQAVANGDKFGISVVGQLITAWWYDSAGDHAWHIVGTYTDDSANKITAAGKVGLFLQGSASDNMFTIDNFSGGTVIPGSGSDSSPTHVYDAPGSYDVTLTVTGTGTDGTDDVTKNVVVHSGSTLEAVFTSEISDALVSFYSQSLAGPSGPIISYNWDFGDGSTHGTTANPTHLYATSGTYTVRLTVTGTGSDGTDYVEHTVNVTVPPPSEGTIFEQFIAKSNFARPAFTPTRTVRFKDKAGLDAAVADLRAGDLVKYDPAAFGLPQVPLTLTSTSSYKIQGKNLTGRAVFDFGCSHNVWDNSKIVPAYVAFSSTGVGWEAFLLDNCSNIDIWGGNYHSDHATGFRIMGNIIDCQVLDIYCHNVGGTGVSVQPIDSHDTSPRRQDGLVIRAEINRFSMNPSHDGHADKGTGSHGALHHGNGGHLDNCHFYYYAHDSLRPGETSFGTVWPEGAGGSACEPGTNYSTIAGYTDPSYSSQNNNHYTVYGENLLMRCTTDVTNPSITNPGTTGKQTGGNLMNNWGNVPMNGMICDFLGAKNITGAIMHGAGSNWGKLANPRIKVLIGRGENTNLYTPSGGTERYVSGNNIDYVDCT